LTGLVPEPSDRVCVIEKSGQSTRFARNVERCDTLELDITEELFGKPKSS
jgi:predicted kinase